MGYPSPGQANLPSGVTVSSVSGLNTSGNDGGVSSDCSEDEGSPGGGGGGGHMPVVYPWMKKIHVAGAGETLSFRLLFLLGLFSSFFFFSEKPADRID